MLYEGRYNPHPAWWDIGLSLHHQSFNAGFPKWLQPLSVVATPVKMVATPVNDCNPGQWLQPLP
jgi:hypothetical protein